MRVSFAMSRDLRATSFRAVAPRQAWGAGGAGV